jgi:hypothetical protein
MKTIYDALSAYKRVAQWNGDSVSDLYEYLKSIVLTLPFLLVQPVTFFLHNLNQNRSLRFDLSNVSEPVLAVDRKGFALIGTLRGFRVVQLRTIDYRDKTYEIAPRTVSVRCRPANERDSTQQ